MVARERKKYTRGAECILLCTFFNWYGGYGGYGRDVLWEGGGVGREGSRPATAAKLRGGQSAEGGRPGSIRRLEQAGRRVWRMGYGMPFKWAGGTLFSVCFSFAVYSNNYRGYSDKDDEQY